MNKIQFEAEIQKVYDNLTKEQFNLLLENSKEAIRKNLIIPGKVMYQKRNDGYPPDIILEDNLEQLIWNIFYEVFISKKISFKQFKALSAYTKTNWIIKQEQEYKQF